MCNRCTADGHKRGSPGRPGYFRDSTGTCGGRGEREREPGGAHGALRSSSPAERRASSARAAETCIMPSPLRARTLSAPFRRRGAAREELGKSGGSACDGVHCQRQRRPDWRQVRIRFILLYEQLRASRLLRDRPSGMFCLQSAIGVGAQASERRSTECAEHGEETAQAASDAGGSAPRIRKQDRARAGDAAGRGGHPARTRDAAPVGLRFGRALTRLSGCTPGAVPTRRRLGCRAPRTTSKPRPAPCRRGSPCRSRRSSPRWHRSAASLPAISPRRSRSS